MPLFTAIGAAAFGAGTFLAGATAFGLQVAAGVGLNLLAQSISGQPAPATPTTGPGFGVQGSLGSGADHPRSFVMGYRATAGSLAYVNTYGKVAGAPNGYLTQVIALSDMPQRADDAGLVGLWVNGEKCTIDWETTNPEGHPVEQYYGPGIGDDAPEKNHLWVRYHDGTQTEADSFLTGTVSSGSRPWESTRVGTGVAYAVLTARVNDTLFSSFPKFKFELAGMPLYDPSKDSSVGGDGDQRWDNPSTWGGDGDDLPAVQIYNILRGVYFQGEWLYGLQGISASRLPAAHWIEQIEKCRAEVDAPGSGSEPRYRSSIEVVVSNDIAATIEALLTACQGRLTESGGVYKLYCGAPGDAVMSFTDNDIISTEEQSFTPFFGLADTITGITAKYPSPDEGWNAKPAPPIYRSDYETRAGGRRLLADVSLDAVPYARQVQQLMQEALQEGQRARRHTHTLPPKFWPLEPGDVVSWTSTRNGYVAKLFRVDGVVDQPNLDVLVDLTEVDPSDYDWDTTEDYVAPVIGPTAVVRPPAQAIVDFDAEGYIIRDDIGLPRRPGILLSWEVPADGLDDITGVLFEVRLTATPAEIVSRGRTDNPTAGSVVISQSLVPDTDYQVRGRFTSQSERPFDWSTWISVTTPDVRFSLEDFNAALRYEVDTKISQIRAEQDAANRLLATLIAEQDAANQEDRARVRTEVIRARGQVTAAYRQEILASVGPDSALAQAIEEVSAAVGNVEANLRVRFVAGVAPDGALARYDAFATAEDALAGLSIIAFDDGMGGAFGQVRIVGDRFYIEGDDEGAVPVFIVDVGPPQKIYLNGDIIAPGSLTVGMLSAGIFEAINANITNLTVENINSNWAIFNIADGITSQYELDMDQNVGQGNQSESGTIFEKTYTSTSGKTLVFGTVQFNNGTRNFAAGSLNTRTRVWLEIRNASNTVLYSTLMIDTTQNMTTLGGVSATSTLVAKIAAGQTIKIRFLMTVQSTSGTLGGGSNANWEWRVGVAELLILEPNGT